LRLEREHVTGSRQVARPRSRVDEDPHGVGPVVSRDPRRDPGRRVDRHGERRAERRGVLRHHRPQFERTKTLPGGRQAHQAAALLAEKVDCVRRHLLCRDHEVSLVLAVFVVHDDDGLAAAQRLQGVLNRIERRLIQHGSICSSRGQGWRRSSDAWQVARPGRRLPWPLSRGCQSRGSPDRRRAGCRSGSPGACAARSSP